MLSTIYSLVSVPVKIYNSNKLNEAIKEIRNELNQVYSDIASAHFNSAIQAFSAAANSRDFGHEVRNGIAHLRDTYNIYELALRRRKKRKSWFGFGPEIDEGYVISGDERAKIYLGNSQIATLISLNYNELGELDNSRTWKSRAINDCDEYAKIVFSDDIGILRGRIYLFSGDKASFFNDSHTTTYTSKAIIILCQINSDYVHEEYDVWYSGPGRSRRETYYHSITSKGQDYLRHLQTKDISELKEMFSKKGI